MNRAGLDMVDADEVSQLIGHPIRISSTLTTGGGISTSTAPRSTTLPAEWNIASWD